MYQRGDCDSEGRGVMSDDGWVIMMLIGLVAGLFFGTLAGREVVHKKWKADAIERCQKLQTKEWCEGRAVLEKW